MNLDLTKYVIGILEENSPFELVKGKFLFREVDPYKSTFFLVDGEVSIIKGKHTLWVAKSNELIGLSTFFSNAKSYGFSAKIVENCKILRVDGESLSRAMGNDSGFSRLVINQLCHRIKLRNKRTKSLLDTPSKFRLIYVLIEKSKESDNLLFTCTLDELSDSVGVSSRLIRRKLTELNKMNLVKYKNGKVEILDFKGLEIYGASPKSGT